MIEIASLCQPFEIEKRFLFFPPGVYRRAEKYCPKLIMICYIIVDGLT